MKKGFCLTKEEMELGLNPDWVIYAKASPELKAVLDKAAAEGFVEELDADAEGWEAPSSTRKRLWGGLVYRVHPSHAGGGTREGFTGAGWARVAFRNHVRRGLLGR